VTLDFGNRLSISHSGGDPDGKVALGVHAVLQIVVDGGTVGLDPSVGLVSSGVVSRDERVKSKESVVEPGLVLEA